MVHNASVMNAIGICGLQLYRYGETISIPFFTETWRPDSFYEKIKRNRSLGLHTLCLLGELTFFTDQFFSAFEAVFDPYNCADIYEIILLIREATVSFLKFA